MSSAYLPEYISNAEFYLSRLVPALIQGALDWRRVQELCVAFRQRGVCSLLLQGIAKPLQINMMRSGGAFLHHLRATDDEQKVTGHAKPFFDAVGGGFWECSREIAIHSRMRWNPDHEYEEDFLYVQFLMKHFFLGADQSECEDILSRCEQVVEGGDQTRAKLCRAFLAGNAAQVDEGIVVLLARRAELVEGMIERGALSEELWSWLRYFSGEGLALLRLAARAGLPLGRTYLHVPEIAWTAPELPFDPDAWRLLDYPSS